MLLTTQKLLKCRLSKTKHQVFLMTVNRLDQLNNLRQNRSLYPSKFQQSWIWQELVSHRKSQRFFQTTSQTKPSLNVLSTQLKSAKVLWASPIISQLTATPPIITKCQTVIPIQKWLLRNWKSMETWAMTRNSASWWSKWKIKTSFLKSLRRSLSQVLNKNSICKIRDALR